MKEVNGTENIDPVEFKDVNLGIAERPETDIVLEKHITGLKITPNGVGVQPIVDAHANIERLLSNDDVLTEGVVTGLAANKSTRETRGFWEVATDVEELMQGAELEVEYTYIVRNEGKQNDYLSNTLVELYKSQDTKSYDSSLDEIINTVKGTMKSGKYGYTADNSNIIGTYLGQHYYTGTVGSSDSVVPTRLETDGLEEAINNAVKFDANYSGEYFKKANGDTVVKTVLDTDGNPKDENIETVIHNASPTAYLTPGSTDYSKKVTLRTVLSSTSGGELGANIPSYIAEAVKYSNAAGRIGNDSVPGNLSYVHSNDNTKTMANSNERDEFWGESIIITKPTGEDKISTMQIAIITVTAVAVLGLGIILIKKFALKK